jgi:hypothetical protein
MRYPGKLRAKFPLTVGTVVRMLNCDTVKVRLISTTFVVVFIKLLNISSSLKIQMPNASAGSSAKSRTNTNKYFESKFW